MLPIYIYIYIYIYEISSLKVKQRKSDMRFGAWNVKSLYMAGSHTAAAREFGRYKLDLVGVQEVRWDNGGTVRTGNYIFFQWKRSSRSGMWGMD